MTELTITEVYAIGLPIILAMILIETLISGFNKKSLYKNQDTLCTSGLLFGNLLIGLCYKRSDAWTAYIFISIQGF